MVSNNVITMSTRFSTQKLSRSLLDANPYNSTYSSLHTISEVLPLSECTCTPVTMGLKATDAFWFMNTHVAVNTCYITPNEWVLERFKTAKWAVTALHPGLQCWHAAASVFCQPSPTCSATFSAKHLWPSGVLSCWPDGLELSPGFYLGSLEQHRLF